MRSDDRRDERVILERTETAQHAFDAATEALRRSQERRKAHKRCKGCQRRYRSTKRPDSDL